MLIQNTLNWCNTHTASCTTQWANTVETLREGSGGPITSRMAGMFFAIPMAADAAIRITAYALGIIHCLITAASAFINCQLAFVGVLYSVPVAVAAVVAPKWTVEALRGSPFAQRPAAPLPVCPPMNITLPGSILPPEPKDVPSRFQRLRDSYVFTVPRAIDLCTKVQAIGLFVAGTVMAISAFTGKDKSRFEAKITTAGELYSSGCVAFTIGAVGKWLYDKAFIKFG